MNLDLIRKKLAQINEQSQEKQDNSALKWIPANGKSQIRIVPSVENPDNPFTELMFYNKLSKYPILALTNFNEQDPVEEFIETLRATDDKDNWSLSGKISARPRYFVPVIVRGEEDKGVRIWSISTTIYKALLSLAADEEIGDFTDSLYLSLRGLYKSLHSLGSLYSENDLSSPYNLHIGHSIPLIPGSEAEDASISKIPIWLGST